MTRIYRRRPFALLLAAHLIYMGAVAASAPAAAMQILEAADHAELAAEISATGVNRIALSHDRIAKVVRAPDGFAVEHDAASGDLYLRPAVPAASGDAAGQAAGYDPVTLFVGTEKGFTYRLSLTPADRDSAQILIRNAQVLPDAAASGPDAIGDPRVAALVRLVRAVARREPLPGYAIHGGGGPSLSGFTFIETWRGPHFAAHVLEADRLPSADADDAWPGLRSGPAGLAGTIVETIAETPGAGRVAALWLAAPGTGPSGGRLAVAVTEAAVMSEPR